MTTVRTLARLLGTAALFLAPPALAQDAAAPTAAPAAAPAAAAQTVDADPALWVVRDADTTIYLFGTVHVLRPGLSWFDEAVKEAFDASDELKIETIIPADTNALQIIATAEGSYPAGTTLTSRMSPEQLTRYQTGLQRFGMAPAVLDNYEPWFVSLSLAQGLYAAMGMTPDSGVEAILTAAAAATNKPISAFETAEQQIGFLNSSPEDEQIAGLIMFFERAAEMRSMLDRLLNSWTEGRPEDTATLMNEGFVNSPETARILLTDRNRRWAESIKARMEQPGIVFIAVGAGHLAGENSVQDFLSGHGLTVERVRY